MRCLLSVTVLLGLAGCHGVSVNVDCRLSRNNTPWRFLDGPSYVIRGPDETTEASLAFQEFSDMWERVLREERPALKRVAIGQPAALTMTLVYNVYDLGTGVASYPVYGYRHFGYSSYHTGAYYRGSSYGFVGTQVETVHLGYARTLFVSAWVTDASRPAGQQVVWEGACDSAGHENSLKIIMPYLMIALGPYYGQATDRPERIRIERTDERVEQLRYSVVATTAPSP